MTPMEMGPFVVEAWKLTERTMFVPTEASTETSAGAKKEESGLGLINSTVEGLPEGKAWPMRERTYWPRGALLAMLTLPTFTSLVEALKMSWSVVEFPADTFVAARDA